MIQLYGFSRGFRSHKETIKIEKTFFSQNNIIPPHQMFSALDGSILATIQSFIFINHINLLIFYLYKINQ